MKKEIPYITLDWVSTPKSDNNVFKFEAATTIIKNKETDLFLAIEFIKNEFWLIWWSVDEGENKEITIIREVEEETGYKNGEIKKIIFQKAYSRWYKARKDREEECCDKVFFVEVEEKNKSKAKWQDFWTVKLHWFTKEEMLDKLILTHHKFYFEEFLKSN